MASNNRISFPKPVNKKSVFDRQRAEAEAKRQREAAETAAVYEDFVKSFDGDGAGRLDCAAAAMTGPSGSLRGSGRGSGRPPLPGMVMPSTGGRRHFSMPSGRPGGQQQQQGGTSVRHGGPRASGRLAFGDDSDSDEPVRRDIHGDRLAAEMAASASSTDRAADRAFSKPTIRLANLPLNMSMAAVRVLVATTGLVVDGVQMLQGTAAAAAAAGTANQTTRKSTAAIVTLGAETAASDMDAAVSALQNHYLGYGYNLSLNRHLSSAVLAAAVPPAGLLAAGGGRGGGMAGPQPFGAIPVPINTQSSGHGVVMHANGAIGYAPPPASAFARGGGRGYGAVPPPASFAPPTGPGGSRGPIYHVLVQPPRDIRQLRMIHMVIESVLRDGPAFEALLMSRPEVQRDERWAWLWDARSEGGVYYRYRLWQTFTNHETRRGQGKYIPLFEGSHAWKDPDPLAYEFVTDVGDFVSDSEFGRSSDDSEDEAEGGGAGAGTAGSGDEDRFLNPLDKARLTHLLARLPTTLGKIRKGDIARITAFAITHASRGSDEIVDLIVRNIQQPFAWTAAAAVLGQAAPAATAPLDGEGGEIQRDPSAAKLIGLYVVNDILSASGTGIRRAWRYRQQFSTALQKHNVFEGLGLLPEQFNWGRLRADKWHRSVNLVLSQWEGWSVFSTETQEFFVSTFEDPPSSRAKREKEAAAAAGLPESKKVSRWKTVDTTAKPTEDSGETADEAEAEKEVDESVYRSDYTDNEELDLVCLREEDIDGQPMSDIEIDGTPLTEEEIAALVGGRNAELSEEGEVGSDDGDEEVMLDANELSDGSSGGEMRPKEAKEETEKAKEKETKEAKAESKTDAEKPGRSMAFQVPASAAASQPRKRMRAADMFAGSDEE